MAEEQPPPLPAYAASLVAVNTSLDVLASLKKGDRVYETGAGALYRGRKGLGVYNYAFGDGRAATMARVEGVVSGARAYKRSIDGTRLRNAALGVRNLEHSFSTGADVATILGRILVCEKELLQMASDADRRGAEQLEEEEEDGDGGSAVGGQQRAEHVVASFEAAAKVDVCGVGRCTDGGDQDTKWPPLDGGVSADAGAAASQTAGEPKVIQHEVTVAAEIAAAYEDETSSCGDSGADSQCGAGDDGARRGSPVASDETTPLLGGAHHAGVSADGDGAGRARTERPSSMCNRLTDCDCGGARGACNPFGQTVRPVSYRDAAQRQAPSQVQGRGYLAAAAASSAAAAGATRAPAVVRHASAALPKLGSARACGSGVVSSASVAVDCAPKQEVMIRGKDGKEEGGAESTDAETAAANLANISSSQSPCSEANVPCVRAAGVGAGHFLGRRGRRGNGRHQKRH